MLSVLAEFQQELIVANTRDGLAAGRARGRRGGRKPKLSAAQGAHAQRLYDGREHTVAQIAGLLGVARTTVYGYLNRPAGGGAPTEIPAVGSSGEVREDPGSDGPGRSARDGARGAGGVAPWPPSHSPGHHPRRRAAAPVRAAGRVGRAEGWVLRDELATTWLLLEPETVHGVAAGVVTRRFCRTCAPSGLVTEVACAVCADGPLLAGELATAAGRGVVDAWLVGQGWPCDEVVLCPRCSPVAPPARPCPNRAAPGRPVRPRLHRRHHDQPPHLLTFHAATH